MPSDDLIDLLRSDLDAAHFTVDSLTELWGPDAEASLHRAHRVPALRALASGTDRPALRSFAALFVLGQPVERARAAAAFGSLGVAGAVELGLIADGEVVHPLLDLRPYSFVDSRGVVSWWIASDLGELSTGGALREDHVLGVGGASLTLSGLMIDTPVDSALDIGTGCGIQAMHAARHAKRVVATDISARALEIATFNATLNRIDSIEFRLGSLFEPVAGELFDQIVSNPPFVITPRGEGVPAYEYRDGGLVGDAIVSAVVASVGQHLRPGGVAQFLGNWEYRPAEDGLDRIAGWTDATGLDAWIVEREQQDASLYAETWIRDGGTRPGAEFDRLHSAWLDDFDRRGVSGVGFGYLLLRRPGGASTLRRVERIATSIGSGLGAHFAECLAAHDWVVGLSDEELGRAILTLSTDVTEERHYWPGNADPTVMTLRQGGGFGRTVPLDTALAALVGACDGELSIRSIIAAIAELLEVEGDDLSKDLLPAVRELVEIGILRA